VTDTATHTATAVLATSVFPVDRYSYTHTATVLLATSVFPVGRYSYRYSYCSAGNISIPGGQIQLPIQLLYSSAGNISIPGGQIQLPIQLLQCWQLQCSRWTDTATHTATAVLATSVLPVVGTAVDGYSWRTVGGMCIC
jgi:hypothetical protein